MSLDPVWYVNAGEVGLLVIAGLGMAIFKKTRRVGTICLAIAALQAAILAVTYALFQHEPNVLDWILQQLPPSGAR
jgi:hypothetical protein